MRTLLFVLALALFEPAFCNAQTTTSEYQEYPVTGPEIWSLKGSSYEIEGTGLLEGKVFIVRAIVAHMPSEADRPDALNIAQFALVQGYRTNAQHFRFLDQFAVVDMQNVGVALIYKKSDASVAGYRFMFNSQEVLGSEYAEGTMNLPSFYSKEPLSLDLARNVWNKLAGAKYEELYGEMSPAFRSSMSLYTFRVQSTKMTDAIVDSELLSFSHFIFIGNTKAGPTYNLFYWLQDNKSKILGLLTVEVGERPPLPNLVGYNVEMSSFYKR